MARRAVNLKFEAADVAAWDVFAETWGLTRTSLVEKVVNAFVATHKLGPYVPGEVPAKPVKNDDPLGFEKEAEAVEIVDARAKFVGSTMEPNADVPELGWYRPGSEEAKVGIDVDKRFLEGLKKASDV